MNIGGVELKVGDPIKYIKYGDTPSTRTRHKQGVITHMTNKIITVNLGKYRDSFTLFDIADKTVEIEGISRIKLQTDEVNAPFRRAVSSAYKAKKSVRDKEKKTTKYIINNWPEIIDKGLFYIETEELGSYQAAKKIKSEFALPVCSSNINSKLRKAYIKKYSISPPRAEHRQDKGGIR